MQRVISLKPISASFVSPQRQKRIRTEQCREENRPKAESEDKVWEPALTQIGEEAAWIDPSFMRVY